MNVSLRYGLELDRDYLVDIVFRVNTILPVVFSLTIYPAAFYLLISHGPSMDRGIRMAYIINLISLVSFDWIFAVFVRLYTFQPYGLYYCEGILCSLGASKRIVMHSQGAFASAIVADIVTFYVLMMRMHQLTVTDPTSRWKSQSVIYASLTLSCAVNLIAFVILTDDVENYNELIKEPELEWLVKRGGTIIIYAEPGKQSGFIIEYFLGMSFVALFFPFFVFFSAHALVYLLKNQQIATSSKTQLITRRLFITFGLQMLGATFFFLAPISAIGTSSILDFSWILSLLGLNPALSDPLLAAIRFSSILFLELNTTQTVLVFLALNARHFKMSKISAAIRRPSVFAIEDKGNLARRNTAVSIRFDNY